MRSVSQIAGESASSEAHSVRRLAARRLLDNIVHIVHVGIDKL